MRRTFSTSPLRRALQKKYNYRHLLYSLVFQELFNSLFLDRRTINNVVSSLEILVAKGKVFFITVVTSEEVVTNGKHRYALACKISQTTSWSTLVWRPIVISVISLEYRFFTFVRRLNMVVHFNFRIKTIQTPTEAILPSVLIELFTKVSVFKSAFQKDSVFTSRAGSCEVEKSSHS